MISSNIRNNYLKWLPALMCSALMSACDSNSDSDNNPSPNSSSSSSTAQTSSADSSSASSETNSFKAVINDFVGYQDWTLQDYAVGATNPFIGGAHGGGVDEISRATYMNEVAAQSSGEFAMGSIIVKEVFTYEMTENGLNKTLLEQGGLLAMVKRGGDFNSDHNGWEWFVLAPDLSSVTAQGADLMNGACNACHSKAASDAMGMDYVFPKPTEVVLEDNAFADYTSWNLIEFNTQPNNLEGGAHVNDASVRRTFKKQLYANPNEWESFGYPIGTMLVKDISVNDEIQQIVAMVKRGGSFDTDAGNWEYFMLQPDDPSKVVENGEGNKVRGALPMCIGCHVKATGELGMDYVFNHVDAPFNTQTMGEFVASKMDLANYANWPLTDYALGASNPFIGAAHSGTDMEFARAVFQNAKTGMPVNEELPVGSILVKETFTTLNGEKQFADAGGLLAMVKRGGTFNPDHNGWEWIMLSEQGDMLARGADLMGGACNACHSKAMDDAGMDYTFTKPSEYLANLESFTGYKSWTPIGVNTGNSPANGGAHNTSSIRTTYKKQGSVSPYFEAGEYPVGTTIVKELTLDGNITQLYGMVKRGGNFNPDHGDWQWFLINTDLSGVTDLGVGAGCTGCHSKAGTEGDASFRGADYVFYHEDDPVPHQ